MPLADRMVHDLTIVTPTLLADLDDYGQPVEGIPETVSLRGFIHPLRASERLLPGDGAPMVADHEVILPIRDVAPSAWVLSGGERYDVQGIEPHAYGSQPLVVLKVRRVVRTDEGVGS